VRNEQERNETIKYFINNYLATSRHLIPYIGSNEIQVVIELKNNNRDIDKVKWHFMLKRASWGRT
jgi:hypothetical protein